MTSGSGGKRGGSGRNGRPTRRHLLRAALTGASVGLAGCSALEDRDADPGSDARTDREDEPTNTRQTDRKDVREFNAGRVGLSADGIRKLSVGHPDHAELVDEYQVSADGRPVTATVRSQVMTYAVDGRARLAGWSVADPLTAAVGVVSTPTAVVSDSEVNPLATAQIAEVLDRADGRELLGLVGIGDGEPPVYVRGPEQIGTLEDVRLLDRETAFESYAGVAAGGAHPDESFLVHAARVRVDVDAVLVLVAQRRRTAGDAEEPVLFDESFALYDDPEVARLLRLAEQHIVPEPPLELDPRPVTASATGFNRARARVFPHGFNYVLTRTLDNGVAWHDTFNPVRYDPMAVQAHLDLIASYGYNLLRVFIDNIHGEGVIEEPGTTGFAPAYLDNVVDFLRRARAAGASVVLCFPRFPPRAGHPPDPTEPIEGRNRAFLYQPFIDYKADYLRDFLAALFEREAALEEVMFAVELENESHVNLAVQPFAERSGDVTTAAGTYDRSSDADLQRMIDDNVRIWANTCVAAVRDVAPDTLVSANVYSYLARRVSGPGDFDPEGDFVTVPFDPQVLAETAIDYLDLHVYLAPPGTPLEELESIDFPTVKAILNRLDKPLLLGEFGAFEANQPGLEAAADAVRTQWDRFEDRGFHGFAFWPFDAADHPRMFGATDGPDDGTILERLADR